MCGCHRAVPAAPLGEAQLAETFTGFALDALVMLLGALPTMAAVILALLAMGRMVWFFVSLLHVQRADQTQSTNS
jgi:hypothetical protein